LRSEAINRLLIAKEAGTDAEAAKVGFDYRCSSDKGFQEVGYLRNISLNPYGFLMLSHLQVGLFQF
jgi:hypothetical protein